MKKLTLIAALVVGTLFATPALAAFSGSGSIVVGQPGTYLGIGAAEAGAACDPDSPLNGTDGVWFDISGNGGGLAVLDPTDDLDADAWFYDADCEWIDDDTMAFGGLGETETGYVPADAAYVIVDGYLGNGSFTLDIS